MEPRYYSNGDPRWDDRAPPNQQQKREDDAYDWWHGRFSDHDAPDDPANPYYGSDRWATIARRELYRNMGGKPRGATAEQYADWAQQAALLTLFMSREPCGAFSSRPLGGGDWNLRAWAALANWYFWLDPQNRWAFLQDVSRGLCNRWMPAVLAARPHTPRSVLEDPTYFADAESIFRIQQAGDDPSHFAGDVDVAKADPIGGSEYVSACDKGPNVRAPIMCLTSYPSSSDWPIKLPTNVPLAVPGLPTPCEPFPQCVASMIPAWAAPCDPMPGCLFELLASLAPTVAPDAVVTRSLEGGAYLPGEAAALEPASAQTTGGGEPPAPAEQSKGGSAWPWAVLAGLGVFGLGTLVVATRRKPTGLQRAA